MSDTPRTLELIVGPGGQLLCLYDESIDLAALGRLTISRGSHVEPTADGRWTAARSSSPPATIPAGRSPIG